MCGSKHLVRTASRFLVSSRRCSGSMRRHLTRTVRKGVVLGVDVIVVWHCVSGAGGLRIEAARATSSLPVDDSASTVCVYREWLAGLSAEIVYIIVKVHCCEKKLFSRHACEMQI